MFDWIFVKLPGNQDRHEISDKFIVIELLALEPQSKCKHDKQFTFDPIFVKLAGNKDRDKIWDGFDIWPDQAIRFELFALEG